MDTSTISRYLHAEFQGIMLDTGAAGVSTAGKPQIIPSIEIDKSRAEHKIRFRKADATSLDTNKQIVMHISTTVLYIALLSILGGSKTAHSEPYQDAFGVTNYGFKCLNKFYPKFAIYAAAKNFCDIDKKNPNLNLLRPDEIGYRNKYLDGMVGEVNYKLENSVIPILGDGTLHPYGM
ncbi:hypothetical protein EPUL_004270 [Erysiphe pulchra]|uniref:Uncharacterized protein n=1 Tax=Erysiphe pulchra TaxID=225359 RepID=A0A2S4PP01_9PEZI|nr:hypothetical protein EPUL_004270 [Erysiphe pulchra]